MTWFPVRGCFQNDEAILRVIRSERKGGVNGPFWPSGWTVLGVYFLGSIVLGSYFARRQKNTEDYLLAGRQTASLPQPISIMATNTSAGIDHRQCLH